MKIVTISDNPNLYSGLARIHRHLIDDLSESGHEVIPGIWHGYMASEIDEMRQGKKAKELFYKTNSGKEIKLYGLVLEHPASVHSAYDLINLSKADVVLTIGDYRSFFYMQSAKSKLEYNFKWISYLTIEESEFPDQWKSLFRSMDAIVVPSKYATESINKESLPSRIVPYGIDHSIFYRVSKERKQELRTARGLKDEDCRFICVAQNTWRKNLPALLLGAKILKTQYPEQSKRIKLYIHTNTDAIDRSEAYLYDLLDLVRQFNLEDMVSFPKSCSIFNSPNDKELAEEYNASDFFILPSTTEGYGLPITEAMACGLPAIANPTTAITEHLGEPFSEDYGNYMRERGRYLTNRIEICPPSRIAHVVDPHGIANAMAQMMGLGSENDKMIDNCLSYAKGLDWSKMKASIRDVVNEIIGPTTIPVEVL